MGSSANAERREANRRRFNGTVELAFPEESECYEADGVDLSIGGMSLKTAFLPDIGSELDCRFVIDGKEPQTVEARAEVVWAKEHGGDAGSFGLRFKDMNAEGIVAVQKMCEPKASKGSSKAQGQEEHASNNVRLRLPTMPKPLKATLRNEAQDAMVVAMDLSFIELGGHLEVDRSNGQKAKGTLEGVDLDIDPQSNTARLVLTVALEGSSMPAVNAPKVVDAVELKPKKLVAHEPAVAEKSHAKDGAVKVEKVVAKTKTSPNNTESLTSSDTLDQADRDEQSLNAHDEDAHNRNGDSAVESDNANSSSLASKSQNAAPAWLLSTMARVRGASKTVWEKAGPALRKTAGLIAAMVVMIAQRVRSKITGKPIAATPAPALEAQKSTTAAPSRTAGKVQLRKQKPENEKNSTSPAVDAISSAESSTAPSARRKFALAGLGMFGVSAIAFALVTGRSEPRPQTPRPQVAVSDSTSTAAAPSANGATPAVTPAANTAGTNAAPAGEGDMGEPSEQPAGNNNAQAGAVPGAPRMPSDLVAAARSRNANLEPEGNQTAPTRRPLVAAAPANARTLAARPAAAPAAGIAHAIGNASLRTGTVLRLRCDGPIANISGGAAGRDSITIRVAGRHIVDRAASFVRMDPRIAGAGAYNHGANSELTLRFNGTAPSFSARTRGDTLEVILAAPAPGAHVSAAANSHARIAAIPAARHR